MKTRLKPFLAFPVLSLLCSTGVLAEDSEKIVIALKTNDFELAATDISDLAIGDAETIVTESGKTIDLLRTADGVEIYVDGELVETPHLSGMSGDHHGESIVHKKVMIECETVDDSGVSSTCEDEMIFVTDGDADFETLHGAGHRLIKIHKSVDGEVEVEVDVEVEQD